MKPVVLVHGAWHGAWCWARVTPLLDAARVPWAVVDLPSCTAAYDGAGVVEDVEAVEAILDDLPGTEHAVLLGHSRGGLVISEAGTHPRVGNLAYLAAVLPAPGLDPFEMVGDTVVPTLDVDGDLVAIPTADRGAADVFYNDCAPDDVRLALSLLRPTRLAGRTVDPPRQAWAAKPSTYIVCSRDAALPAAHQRRMASHASAVMEWDTGHSPFINRPDLVAGLLSRLATASP